MATGPRRLSFKKLITLLDVDDNPAAFMDAHAGNESNLVELFENINALQEKHPADHAALMEAINGLQNPDDMVEALAGEIYREPPKKTGIRGKTDAPAERVERVGSESDKRDIAALPATPPATEPKATGKGAKKAAKKAVAKPAANASASAETNAAATAAASAPAPENAGGPIVVGNMGGGESMSASPPGAVFQMGTDPASMAAADPMELGLQQMLFNQFSQPAAGAFDSSVANIPMDTGMPRVGPATPPPDATTPDANAGAPTPPPAGSSNPFDSVDWSQFKRQGFSAPDAGSPDALANLLDGMTGGSGAQWADPPPPKSSPAGAGSLPTETGYELMADTGEIQGASGFAATVPPAATAPSKSWLTGRAPVTSMANEFLKSRNLDGFVNANVITKPLDAMLYHAPWALPTAAAYYAANQPQQRTDVPTDDDMMAAQERERQAFEALKTIPPPPQNIGVPRTR